MGNHLEAVQTCAYPTIDQLTMSGPEECCVLLSERDAAQVLEDIRNPPLPNEAALLAAQRFKKNYG